MDYLFGHFRTNDYYTIFSWMLFVFIFFGSLILRHLKSFDKFKFVKSDRSILISFLILLIFLTGTRGIFIGTDTWNYYYFYYLRGIHKTNIIDFFSYFDTDFFFKVIMYFSFLFKSFTFFLLTVSIIINISLFKFVRKFTDKGISGSSLMLFLTLASSMVFFTQQINVIRNGLAIPFILFGIYYMSIRDNKSGLLYFILAFFFHRTALIPFICAISVVMSEKVNYKYFILLYISAIGLAFAGFGFHKLSFLAGLGGEDIERLSFSGETEYRIGFRIDFVLYNSFFLFLFVKFSALKNKTDIFLIKYYILASIIFYFNFRIPFSDRIGAYSWIVIPLLLFNIIKNSFPQKKLYVLTLATFLYFSINFIILPLMKGKKKSSNRRVSISHIFSPNKHKIGDYHFLYLKENNKHNNVNIL